ncbi:MAG UNVERIFIED_CONTAM: hypothetical protein LVR18_45855 [Planctomycetaceae bacterium]|jgi:hypothetical protein
MDGAFEFKLTSQQLLIFGDTETSIGPAEINYTAKTTGLLIIDGDGIGVRLDIVDNRKLFDAAEMNLTQHLLLNSTGKEFVYEVPEEFLDVVDYTELTIRAGAPKPDGTEGPAEFYVVVQGTGNGCACWMW